MKTYDVAILGFGKGGKTLAGKLAAAGKTVVLAEQDAGMYGGTCINVGCIPSKSLIHSASGVDPSVSFSEKATFYREAIREKRRLTAMLRQKNFDKLAQQPSVTIINGQARFVGPHEVTVETTEGPVPLSAGQIVINTGSTPRIPPIPGIAETPGIYTSAGLMELETLPRRLVVIGGGYIGLEFASLYARFGSEVTVLQDGGAFLPQEDEDVSAAIGALLQRDGVTVRLGVRVQAVEAGAHGPVVVFTDGKEEYRIAADAVLVATGRIPNTAALGCEAAGVALASNGAVRVDAHLRTTVPHIWAVGDVTGGRQHTYLSLDDARIVWPQLSGDESRTTADRANIPYSVFLSTPYARVGLNEREARAAGHSVKIARLPAAAIPKAQVLRAPDGLLKAVIDAASGQILGAMLLCEESFETINVIKLAMDLGADYRTLRDQIFTHPTMTEALNDLFAV